MNPGPARRSPVGAWSNRCVGNPPVTAWNIPTGVRSLMSASDDLLFADIIRQLGLIGGLQYDELCLATRRQPETSASDFCLARGWLTTEDCRAVVHLVSRRVFHAPVGGTVLSSAPSQLAALPETPDLAPAPLHPAQTVIDEAVTAEGESGPTRRKNVTLASATLIENGTLDAGSPFTKGSPVTLGTEAHSRASAPRYRLEKLHATGGMGRIWRAWDEQLHRQVAIKELRPEVTRSPTLTERFLREARLTGQLEHPGIIPVHELSAGDGTRGPFYAMRFMQGETLHQAIQDYHRQPTGGNHDGLGLVRLLAVFVAACNTVAYAHSHHVIHRDLKGDNVLLGKFGEVVVVDWGLARLVDGFDDQPGAEHLFAPDPTDSRLTLQGQVVGTPAYMSPEQADGRIDLDHRTDIYSLGAILYEILTGRPPYTGSSTVEILLAAQRGDPVPPRQIAPHVPHVLEAICIKALARNRDDRFSSAAELALDVQRWQESERQAAEAEVRASRERFELAVQGSQDGLWDWDLTTNVVYFSPRWKSILGYEDHEIADNVDEWISRLHPDEHEQVLAANYAHIHGTTQHYEYEYRLRHKDGSYRWILARGAALRDSEGRAYRMAGSHVDVTERRQTEQQLRDVEQLYHAVRELIPQPLVLFNPDGTVQPLNPAAEELLVLPAGSLPVPLVETVLAHSQQPDGTRFSWDGQSLIAFTTQNAPEALLTLVVPPAAPRHFRLAAQSLESREPTQGRATIVRFEQLKD